MVENKSNFGNEIVASSPVNGFERFSSQLGFRKRNCYYAWVKDVTKLLLNSL